MIMMGASLVLVGGLVYYLSSDDAVKKIVIDPKQHTKEKLIEIIEDLTLEYTCSYLFMNNILK
jgi:hypothetical protein